MSLTLDHYLNRLGIKSTPSVSETALAEIQRAQLMNIPFENLDCLHDKTISIDSKDLAQKILQNARGGYCFELNQILLEGLTLLGFNVRPILSRVMYRGIGINPKTHIFLVAEIGGAKWIADTGFGGPGLFDPMPMELNRIDHQPHGSFRLIEHHEFGFILQKAIKESNEWMNVFAFNLDKVYPADLLMANFYVSQHPESHFRHNLIAALFTENGRHTLLNRKLTTTYNSGSSESREIETQAELNLILTNLFGINLPNDYQFNKLWSA